MPETLSAEPPRILAGSTVVWTRSAPDHDSGDGYTVSYYFANTKNAYTLSTVTGSGGTYTATAAATTTAAWRPGTYTWVAYATLGADKYELATGTMEFLPDFSAGNPYDGRSTGRQLLDEVENTLKALAARTITQKSIGGASYSFANIGELIALRDKLRGEVAHELDAEEVAGGRPSRKTIQFRFDANT